MIEHLYIFIIVVGLIRISTTIYNTLLYVGLDNYCIDLVNQYYAINFRYSWYINKELSIYLTEWNSCIVVLENDYIKEWVIIEFSYYDLYEVNNNKIKEIWFVTEKEEVLKIIDNFLNSNKMWIKEWIWTKVII